MIAPIDDEGITIASPLALTDFGDQLARFRGHGWNGLAIAARQQQVIAAAMAETKAAAHDEPRGADRRRLPSLPRGGYELIATAWPAQVTLFASGSELMIAVAARPLLAERDISTRAGARPPFDLILAPPERDARRSLVRCRRGGVKGAVRFGCDPVIGPDGGFIGMCGRAGGAPAQHSDRPFGITAQPAAAAAMAPAAGCSPCG